MCYTFKWCFQTARTITVAPEQIVVCYPHMPIGKVWIYRLLFVCVCARNFVFFACLFVRLLISPPRIKLVASNFARWFIGLL